MIVYNYNAKENPSKRPFSWLFHLQIHQSLASAFVILPNSVFCKDLPGLFFLAAGWDIDGVVRCLSSRDDDIDGDYGFSQVGYLGFFPWWLRG